MRYIGNKTKLLGEIERLVGERGVGPGATLLDIFAGTASVARHFKGLGFRCLTNDRMRASYALQVATVEVSRYPAFAGVLARPEVRAARDAAAVRAAFERARGEAPAEAAGPLCLALAHLEAGIAPAGPPGLIARCFSPAGPGGRMYFRQEHARRIDAVLDRLVAWRRDGTVARAEFYLLLSSLIAAADRVANISGTYGAFLKTWQANTQAPLRLDPPPVVESPLEHRAYRADGNRLARALDCDVLYVDPPYNHRDYAANYHVLEVIAERYTVHDEAAYEARLYGVTGMRPYARSAYCSRRGDRCARAFRDLVTSARAEHVVVSYNEEGILAAADIESALEAFAGRGGRVEQRRIAYRRFRSDADGRVARNGAAPRTYRVLDGRGRDGIHEWLFHARRVPGPARAARAGRLRGSERPASSSCPPRP